MPTVKFTRALKRFYPSLAPLDIQGATVAQIVAQLDTAYPGLRDYIVDERGQLRQHVNIFIRNTLVKDRMTLSDALGENDEVYIMQALSGG